ncbi:PQQ-binding-like beta-propeller repeat protein [Streptomyces sp. NPDC102406]|uniref:outer membrane protein assembly factor BamB family protein n=1 Tax=Streptomyces sp. NPDC102406 TaxID=3366171 RepID=UPI00380DA1E3
MTFGPPPSEFTQSRQEARGRGRRRSYALAVSFVAVLALLAGLWFLWSEMSGSPAELDRKATPSPAADDIRESVEARPRGGAGHLESVMMARGVAPGKDQLTSGTWVTKENLVKGVEDALVAVKIGTSEEDAWRTQLPGTICAAAPYVTVDGRTAVAYEGEQKGAPKGEQDEDACDHLTMFDLDTGKKLWDTKIPWKSSLFDEPTRVTMTRGVVVATWWEGAVGVDMRTGKTLWERSRTKKCHDAQFQGGKALVVSNNCSNGTDYRDVQYKVQKLDPRSGRVVWSYQAARYVHAYVVSSKPTVIAVEAGENEITDLLSLDDHGKLRATIRMEGDHYEVNCDPERGDGCAGAIVTDDQVFVASGAASESLGNDTNWLVGFDLATGRSGVKFEAGPDQTLHPIRMSGGRILAVKEGTDEVAPMTLVELDPATGGERPYFSFNLPAGATDKSLDNTTTVVIEDARIYFGNSVVTGSGKKSLPDSQWMAVGIGRAD